MKSKKPILQLLHTSLVSKVVKIISHSDPTFENLSGQITSETRQTLTIDVQGELKKISKDQGIFEFEMEGSKIQVNGLLLVGDGTKRSKRRHRGW